jgi:dipeptidase E
MRHSSPSHSLSQSSIGVRLYLSSFRLGKHAHRIAELLGRAKPRVLAIMNALDTLPEEKRHGLYRRLCEDFASIGIQPQELDLRAYFTDATIDRALAGCDLIWTNGGNAFTLRAAMRRSGFDRAVKALLGADAVVYGGHSAGAVVATPSLKGIELVDTADPTEALPPGYGPDLVWEGLGLVPYAIVPHYRSDHVESEKMERVVEYFEHRRLPFRALHDGEAILVNGNEEILLTL